MRNFVYGIYFFLLSAVCYGADQIGKVVAVEGVLKALNVDLVERILKQGAEVFLGDTLITEEAVKGEVKFKDGTMILLIPNSRFSLDSYAANQFEGKNEYLARLQQGGVRVTTGWIAKKNPDHFQVDTPNATIGVRGTVFETRVYGGDVYAGTSSGNISLENNAGSLSIGSDNPNRFAVVSSRNKSPQPLAARPDALDMSNFSPPGSPPAPSGATGAASFAGSSGGFAWGPAVGGLAVIGVVVGVVVAAAVNSGPSFSHSGGAVATLPPPPPPPPPG